MAAAFYGLVRFAEAQELEKELGPRLGLSVPTGEIAESAGKLARKETSASETQTQFKFEDMVAFFVADGIRFVSDKEKGLVTTIFSGRHSPVCLIAHLDDQRKVMSLLFRLPMTLPEERRVEMAEAITRANCGLPIGCFELDMHEGQFNYRVGVPFDDAVLSHSQFRHSLAAAIVTIDRYVPAFSQVVFGGVSAKDAIEECEN